MAHEVISATTLARNFSEYLNRVRYQGVTLDVTRGNAVVACLSAPSANAGYPIAKLDALLASLPSLSPDEAATFEADVATAMGQLTSEADPWAS